jgi:hypothetical protein
LLEYRYTDGNLIVLYAISKCNHEDGELPGYIEERVKLCMNIFKLIMQSKPDRNRTSIVIVADTRSIRPIKEELIRGGIDQEMIMFDSVSKNVNQCFDHVIKIIKNRSNPPYIYFIGSVWLKDIYDSTVVSRLKGYRIQFEGALDHRTVGEIEKEKESDKPKKGVDFYKKRVKDKTVDILLDYIFPEHK